MARKKKPASTAHYTHHSARRTNIPTSETQALLTDDEQQPQTWTTRRRPGELPTLSWDRRSKPDRFDAYPLYIREKVHPGAFVKSLQSAGTDQPGLFEDFNGLPPDASYEWYRHTGNWQNRLIHGESARVMASLAQREGLAGQVQMIFFDPPYGIGFKSNFQVAVRKRETKENRQGLPADPKMIRAFRDTYERGIDSYLDQMLEKLTLARDLLTESGSIFVQIGDENVHRMAVLLDEVFGHENRVATIPFATTSGSSSRTLPSVADYLLWYAKDKTQVTYRQMYESLDRSGTIRLMSWHAMVELADGTARKLTPDEQADPENNLPSGVRLYKRTPLLSPGTSTTGRSKTYRWNGHDWPCPPGQQWRVSPDGMDRLAEIGRLDAAGPGSVLTWKCYEEEIPGRRINNVWAAQRRSLDKRYVVQTAASVIERCILMATDPGDLVFDPTCGSGVTAAVAERWGRRWITCDTSAVAVAVARQRLITAMHPFWAIAQPEYQSSIGGRYDPAAGFIYERIPYVSAARLAYDLPQEYIDLVDQPEETHGVVRVCSPFTVESETAYAYIPISQIETGTGGDSKVQQATAAGAFVERVVRTLLETGIKDTLSAPAVEIHDIEPWPGKPGSLVTHKARCSVGRFSAQDAALMIAAEDVTVTPAMLTAAAAQAPRQIHGAQLLIAAAFAFDPATTEDTRIGRVRVLRVMMNRDLQIGELDPDRHTEAFVMLAEPDLAITTHPDGQLQVELLGFDTFNPRTGAPDSGTAQDVACWMIDTDHDGLSFFARRIHFPNATNDRQVKRLKKALGRGIHQLHWNATFSTKSAPFPPPQLRPDSHKDNNRNRHRNNRHPPIVNGRHVGQNRCSKRYGVLLAVKLSRPPIP